jgi:GTPase
VTPEPTPAPRTVAIVGRPNVGKSALFNRLAGRKISIVHDQPGVTRDRLSAECKLGRKRFTVVDTGGIGSVVDASFAEQVRTEADIAIATADVIVFVVDAQDGRAPVDEDLAQQLRRADKPLILAVNKIDDEKHAPLASDFARLGFENVVLVSAEHGRGTGELVERVESFLPETETPAATQPELPLAIAIVGRPNVGKSSLINAILEDRRTMVSDIPGTTRDAVDVPYARDGRRYMLIDTAGIRPRGRHKTSVEVFSVMRAEKSIRRADLCVLVIDPTAGVTAQDKKIAGLIQDVQKPCVVVLNKWDLIEADTEREQSISKVREQTRAELFFLEYAPIVMLSAKTGDNVERLFRCIDAVREAAQQRIGTGPLNRLLHEAFQSNPPPIRGGRRFKVLYATQVEKGRHAISTPAFVLFVNDAKLLPESYRRYLEAQIREHVRLLGLPISLQLRGREPRKK